MVQTFHNSCNTLVQKSELTLESTTSKSLWRGDGGGGGVGGGGGGKGALYCQD